MFDLDFFQTGPIPENAMTGFYEPKLVLLSYVVAVLASLAALEIAQRIRQEKHSLFLPLLGGAFVMGAGIFSMHFIGMLSFVMPMPAEYNFSLTLLSLIIAIGASGFSFFLIKDPNIKVFQFRFIFGGLILGIAIASMHYTGMSAMEGVSNKYLPGLFFLSIFVAITASLAALFLMLECEKGSHLRQRTLKLFSALVMGAAICGMHYIGMEAAVMTPLKMDHTAMQSDSFLLSNDRLAFLIAFVTSSIVIIALLFTGYRHLIAAKLVAGFLIAPLLIVPLAVLFLQNIHEGNQWSTTITNDLFPQVQTLNGIQNETFRTQILTAQYIHSPSENKKNEILKNLEGLSRLQSEDLKILKDNFLDATQSLIESIEKKAPENVIANEYTIFEKSQNDFESSISHALSLRRSALKKWNQDNIKNGEESKSLFLFITGSIFLFTVASGLLISYQIAKPILNTRNASKKIAIGDLNEELLVQTNDEVGQLGTNFNEMIRNLKQISDVLTAVSNGDLTVEAQPRSDQDSLGLALSHMIKNLRHINGEIQTEVGNLTQSAQKILSSVSEIATSSAETASAITETTTSVEELKQTAYVTDDMAKNVLITTKETVQIVNASEELLQATMDDMNQISVKMNTISMGMVKLSEHNQTISKIIDTVNDLAEQSNLLAVNAAIEAAQAGEHGKTFSIVAQEIRILAEQSKSATIQVRAILNEIRNSTSAVVLATEQGDKAVKKGVKQSIQTNESMVKLTQSMAKVTQAANQIAISIQQQFIGVDQLTVAMNNISDSTSQLVDNMKHIESAAASLNAIGASLKNMTDHYIMNK